jgi:hypothetical protein
LMCRENCQCIEGWELLFRKGDLDGLPNHGDWNNSKNRKRQAPGPLHESQGAKEGDNGSSSCIEINVPIPRKNARLAEKSCAPFSQKPKQPVKKAELDPSVFDSDKVPRDTHNHSARIFHKVRNLRNYWAQLPVLDTKWRPKPGSSNPSTVRYLGDILAHYTGGPATDISGDSRVKVLRRPTRKMNWYTAKYIDERQGLAYFSEGGKMGAFDHESDVWFYPDHTSAVHALHMVLGAYWQLHHGKNGSAG